MSWKKECVHLLRDHDMFQDYKHMSRFKELMDCFGNQPFFHKGVCKCMYLSAWDEEHFAIILQTLNNMCLGKDHDTKEMEVIGDSMAQEQLDDEAFVYILSVAFLENKPFHMNENVNLRPETAYIINRALKASALIDEIA